MEEDEPKAKKRVLPQWMRENKPDTKKPFMSDVKRKKDRSPRKCTVYCMNERELVDYALEILNKNKKEPDSETETKAAIERNKVDICRKGRSEEPQTSSEASRILNLTQSPTKDSSVADTQSDEEDDPLKYVREIFFS